MIYRIEVVKKWDSNQTPSWLDIWKKQFKLNVSSFYKNKVYWIETEEKISEAQLSEWARNVFSDVVSENYICGFLSPKKANHFLEKYYLPMVTDNEGAAATEALEIWTGVSGRYKVRAGEAWQFEVESHPQLAKAIESTLINSMLHSYNFYSSPRGADWILDCPSWSKGIKKENKLLIVNLLEEGLWPLEKMNNERGLALNQNEIESIYHHYKKINRNPTEVEVEVIAQTWSEHCKHKIFAASIEYNEAPSASHVALGSMKFESLYKTFIKKTTEDLNSDYLVSVFSDNSGVVSFDDQINICMKAETHNSPSALDPYGGALTGILGVNRDILGTGIGAKPIANTDIFCLSLPSDFPSEGDSQCPQGLKRPEVILEGVFKGVEDGGNQSGIPTINGSLYFHPSYVAKPLIYVGSLGVMPKTVRGRSTEEKIIKSGDKVVVVGGRLGKDGVHGATFSSMELKEGIPSSVVQIGDPITQKRVIDFTLQARDQGLFRCITDNGAGGLSSSVGELAQLSGGVVINVAKHPLKYDGLEFYEMVISESQERMTYAVAPEHESAFLNLAKQYGVEASVLGEFNQSGLFSVYHNTLKIADLDLNFLHKGCPQIKLKATWYAEDKIPSVLSYKKKKALPALNGASLQEALIMLLQSPNVASKESLVRRYDHEVQASTHIKNFTGSTQSGPSDAAVFLLEPHGGHAQTAIAVGHGLAARYSEQDTYKMTVMAVDECIRNLISVGADPEKLAVLDNFCWPDPIASEKNLYGERRLAELVRSCAALQKTCMAFKTPIISGKDSMKNNFKGVNQAGEKLDLSVVPTLLVSGLGFVPNTQATMTSDFKKSGDRIVMIGEALSDMTSTEFSVHYQVDTPMENPDITGLPSLYKKIHQLIQKKIINSCHDISEGGALVSVCESLFGSNMGAQLTWPQARWSDLFGEGVGLFIMSVSENQWNQFSDIMKNEKFSVLGQVTSGDKIEISLKEEKISLDKKQIFNFWRKGLDNEYSFFSLTR